MLSIFLCQPICWAFIILIPKKFYNFTWSFPFDPRGVYWHVFTNFRYSFLLSLQNRTSCLCYFHSLASTEVFCMARDAVGFGKRFVKSRHVPKVQRWIGGCLQMPVPACTRAHSFLGPPQVTVRATRLNAAGFYSPPFCISSLLCSLYLRSCVLPPHLWVFLILIYILSYILFLFFFTLKSSHYTFHLFCEHILLARFHYL